MRTRRGQVFRSGSGWGFYFSYTVNGQRRQVRRHGFASSKAAHQALTQALAHVDGGRLLGATTQTVGEFLDSWLVSYEQAGRRKVSTVQSVRTTVRCYLRPVLGDVLLRDLNAKTVSDALGRLLTEGRHTGRGTRRGLSPKTVRNVAGVLRKALGDAVRWGLIPVNYVTQVELPRYERPHVVAWDSEQSARFLAHSEAVGDPLHVLWRLLLVTGLRRGELLGLRWQDVDLVLGTVTVEQSRVRVDHRVVVSTPKTRAGRRTVSIDPTTVTLLAQLRNAQEATADLLGRWGTDLVAASATGQPLDPPWLLDQWKRAARAAGVPVITLHQGRHTALTQALQNQVPLHVVAGRAGHAQASTTVNLYAHYLPLADRQAADLVGAHFDAQVRQAAALFGSRLVAEGSEHAEQDAPNTQETQQTRDCANHDDPADCAPPGIRTEPTDPQD